MFSRELREENRILKDQWQKKASGMLGGKELKTTNTSGIELKPVYTPEDLDKIDYQEISLPGEYPFTRGNYPLHYQVMPLMQNIALGFGTAEDTRQRREWLSKLGCSYAVGTEKLTPLLILTDLPTQRGKDPDEPEARSRVGQCGVSISNLMDVEDLFDGLPLNEVLTSWNALDSMIICHALYAVYAQDIRKEPLEKLFMVCCNVYHHQYWWDTIAFPPATAIKIETELIKFIVENCPLSLHTIVDGYNSGEAGASPAQETAFALAHVIHLMEECIKAGLDPDAVAPGFWAHPHIGLNFFEEIAKIRATRKVWAKIMKERFGCKNPESLKYKVVVAQTGGTELTAQEPLNNIIRLTIMTMAGMLAGEEGIWTAAYDEAVGLPTEEAVQIAVRTQQILAQETDIPHVTDPLGGSYYIEWLTGRMEEEINKILAHIEEQGGFLKAWESGWLRGESEKGAYARLRKLDKGEKIKIGMNKYRIEETSEISAFRPSLEAEKIAIERVQKYRQERDNSKTEVALSELRKAAIRIEKEWPQSCGVLMPALIEAARARATLGEMHRVLREVFGYGYYSG